MPTDPGTELTPHSRLRVPWWVTELAEMDGAVMEVPAGRATWETLLSVI